MMTGRKAVYRRIPNAIKVRIGKGKEMRLYTYCCCYSCCIRRDLALELNLVVDDDILFHNTTDLTRYEGS